MDALSALRTAVAPVLRGASSIQNAPEAFAPRTISPAELEQLHPGAQPQSPDRVAGAQPFEAVLGQLVQDVNARQVEASDAVRGLLSGQNVPLHQVMISAEEASLSFQLMVEVRNKLLESYQELMRMQI
jgi:flagellar hook-basal body complex protein FliE